MKIRDQVIKTLKNYLETKANIEISKMNIIFYEEELKKVKRGEITLVEHDNDIANITRSIYEYMYTSPVEKEYFRNSKIKYADAENLKEKIEREKSLLMHYEEIIKVTDSAIKILSEKEKYIIKISYLSEISYKWADILKNFNKEFKVNLELNTVQNYKTVAITKLTRIMGNSQLIKCIF